MSPDIYDEVSRGANIEPDPLPRPDRVLTVGAHPDDAEFGAGATLARWADGGTEITMLIVTDGSMGSWDPDVDRTELVQRRKAEQRAAASVLGASDLIFFDLPDGELVYDSDLRTSVADVIRAVRPDVVLGHDPWQRYQLHPDHRATGLATVDGVVSAREPLAHSLSGHPHHRPNAILLWSADTPDHVEPASEATFQRKIDALLCHSSQAVTTMGDATASDHAREEFETRMRRWMADGSIPHGIELGETFKRLIP